MQLRAPILTGLTGLSALTALTAAACADQAPPGHGASWPEATALFHREARFIGADGAYTVDLGGDRILWLFGDTFVARDHDHPHAGAAFLRNSVALQTGRDPSTAYIRHYWRHTASSDAAGAGDEDHSFFPEPDAATWLWPGSGIRVDDTLVLFVGRLHNHGAPSATSYVGEGWDARVVDNPDDDPDAWHLRPAILPPDGGAGRSFGESLIALDDADRHVIVYGTRGASHGVELGRFRRADVVAGDLSHLEHWCGPASDEARAWSEACDGAILFSPGAPEFSVHRDAARDRWIWVATGGYGATAIAYRVAPAPEGPWSDPTTVFRPPESFAEGAFVYAGKAHPELDAGADGAGALVVTYVPAGFHDFPAALDGVYYFPFFARVWLE